MIEDGHEVDGVLTVQLAPGHTPGNAHIRLASKGAEAIFAGDTVHHPMQAYVVGCSTVVCLDPAAAALSRRRLLEACVERNALLLPGHFAAPHAARVTAAGNAFALRFTAA
jgi:glyoxylase-like metal-dependent hydrolase (beta-lactamase superfamily II)